MSDAGGPERCEGCGRAGRLTYRDQVVERVERRRRVGALRDARDVTRVAGVQRVALCDVCSALLPAPSTDRIVNAAPLQPTRRRRRRVP